MIALDEDALICDFAETYHIYDYTEFPVQTVARLAAGLHENSRVRMKMSDNPVDTQTMLLAAIADRLSILIWQNTKDGTDGTNFPVSILDGMLNGQEEKKSDVLSFDSPDAFWTYRENLIGGDYG